MKFLPLAILSVLALSMAGCGSSEIRASGSIPARLLAGEWGWEGTDDCTRGPLRFRFSENGERMLLSHLTETEDGHKGPPRVETSYVVIDKSDGKLGLRKEGESLVDDMGRPVTWDLVMIDDTAYCWHRSDWPARGCTKPVRRCGP